MSASNIRLTFNAKSLRRLNYTGHNLLELNEITFTESCSL